MVMRRTGTRGILMFSGIRLAASSGRKDSVVVKKRGEFRDYIRSIFMIGIAAVCAVSLSAQEGVSKFTMQIGAGFTTGVGHSGKDLDLGWNMSGGAGVNFNEHVSAMVNISEQLMGTPVSVPGNLSVAGGRMQVFSATLDPVLHLCRGMHADFYVTGGGGMFRRSFRQ